MGPVQLESIKRPFSTIPDSNREHCNCLAFELWSIVHAHPGECCLSLISWVINGTVPTPPSSSFWVSTKYNKQQYLNSKSSIICAVVGWHHSEWLPPPVANSVTGNYEHDLHVFMPDWWYVIRAHRHTIEHIACPIKLRKLAVIKLRNKSEYKTGWKKNWHSHVVSTALSHITLLQ